MKVIHTLHPDSGLESNPRTWSRNQGHYTLGLRASQNNIYRQNHTPNGVRPCISFHCVISLTKGHKIQSCTPQRMYDLYKYYILLVLMNISVTRI